MQKQPVRSCLQAKALTGPAIPKRPVCAPMVALFILSQTASERRHVMWLSSLLARRHSNSGRSTRHTRRSTKVRLALELLDHRAVPAFVSAGASPFAGELLKVGDVNNGGGADVVSNGPGAAVSVRLGNGDGSFGAAQSSIASVSGTSPTRVVVGDINRDGNLDVVTGSSGSQSDFSV